MRLTRVARKRTQLQQSLILVIMTLVAMIMLLSHHPVEGYWIDVFAVLCLLVCLFVLIKERQLRKLEALLRDELSVKDQAVNDLSRELTTGHYELVEEKVKAAELEDKLREITMLYRAINRVNNETNDDQVPRIVLQAALELIGGDRGSIMLLDDEKQYLSVETSIGIENRVARTIRQKVGDGVAGWVAEFGRPTLVSGEAQDDGRFRKLNKLKGRIRSAVCVPLKLKNETIGVMNIGLTGSGSEEFRNYHTSLATIFGEHASMAIMYSRLRRFSDEENAILSKPRWAG